VATSSATDLNTTNRVHSRDVNTPLQSELVDGEGEISIDRMLIVWEKLQRGTTMKSRHIIHIDPKFTLRQATDETDPHGENGKLKKMTTQEASQQVCIIQVLAKDVEKEKKVHKMRSQNFSKGL